MKRVLYASVIALGCTIAVAAQGGAADQSKDKGEKKDATEKAVTLTGCVAKSGGHFMLNNATMKAAPRHRTRSPAERSSRTSATR